MPLVALAVAMLTSVPGANATASSAAPQCGSTWEVVLGGKGGVHPLLDVAAASARDVWAGGELNGSGGPYLLHWNRGWTHVPIPAGTDGVATIDAIDARSSDDIWAVGERGTKGTPGRYPYAIHWNGKRWKPSKLPFHRRGELVGIVALRHEVWAIGNGATSGNGQPLAFHRRQSGWRRVAIPDRGFEEFSLTAIAGSSADDVWLAGIGGEAFRERGFVQRWNGSRWRFDRRLPLLSQGIDVSASQVMVVGTALVFGTSGSAGWFNGRRWRIVPTPAPPDFPQGKLLDVDWTSPSSAWAVGAAGNSTSRFFTPTSAYVEHWNGSRWEVDSQAPFGSHSVPSLNGVSSAGGVAWAVGSRYPKGGFVERRC